MQIHSISGHPRARVLADTIPGEGVLRNALLISGGVVLTALLAQVRVPLPFTPVPITGQTLAVLLVGAALGSSRGALSQVAYVCAGAAGLPVFAGAAGIGGPTTGYLFGFILAAALVGRLCERGWDHRMGMTVAAMVIGTAGIYVCGVLWLWLVTQVPIRSLLPLGVTPFLPGAAVKIMVAAVLLPSVWSLIGRARMGSHD